jgi:hypothetical protein
MRRAEPRDFVAGRGGGLGSPPTDCCQEGGGDEGSPPELPGPEDEEEEDPFADNPPGSDEGVDAATGDRTGPGNTYAKNGSSPSRSLDPNDKLVAVGSGYLGHIPPNRRIPYTIRFENMADAALGAQLITVTDPLPETLDWASFAFGDMRFSFTDVDVPPGLQHFETEVDLRPEGNRLIVRIVADFDVNTGFMKDRPGEDPEIRDLEDHRPLFEQLFAAYDWNWIYASSAAKTMPYDPEHNAMYSEVLGEALSAAAE